MGDCEHTKAAGEVERERRGNLVVLTATCADCGERVKEIVEGEPSRFDAMADDADASERELRFETPERFVEYDLVLNTRTGELVRVDELRPPATLVTRGLGSPTGGEAMLAGDEVLRAGDCRPEAMA